jgi:hypothetical protein
MHLFHPFPFLLSNHTDGITNETCIFFQNMTQMRREKRKDMMNSENRIQVKMLMIIL